MLQLHLNKYKVLSKMKPKRVFGTKNTTTRGKPSMTLTNAVGVVVVDGGPVVAVALKLKNNAEA